MLEVDEQLMSGLLPDTEGSRQVPTANDGAARARERFVLFRLPSTGTSRLDALLALLSLVKTPVSVDTGITNLMHKFPRITRRDVAIRHLRVLVALGFADIQQGSIFLTPDGHEFLKTSDLAILRSALISRIYGAKELLSVLRDGQPAKSDILGLLRDAGLTRINETQANRLVEWFLLGGLIRRTGEHLVLADED